MDFQEYETELQKIEQSRKRAIRELQVKYAKSNNPYKIGDIVTDHVGSIIIEKISVQETFNSNIPECVYFGIELLKNGKPNKRGNKRQVFQTNIKYI